MELDEITALFVEECFEGLDLMESALDIAAIDQDSIDSIFRAAHSIKGGAATFGFPETSHVAHGVESVLAHLRDQRIDVSTAPISVLLEAVDLMRAQLSAATTGVIVEQAQTEQLIHALQAALDVDSTVSTAATEAIHPPESDAPISLPADTNSALGVWKIAFRPGEKVFERCIDPLSLLRALELLGTLKTKCTIDAVPSLEDIDPEQSYLAWDLELHSDCDEQTIVDTFDWIEGDCMLQITAPGTQAPEISPHQSPAQNSRQASTKSNPLATNATASSFRVGTEQIDELINLVGELVITQSMLHRVCNTSEQQQSDELQHALTQLDRSTRDLQESVLRIRMLPIGSTFSRLRRVVRDLSSKLGKPVELNIEGESTELDKTVLEKISDPLLHLIRNAMDHGFELPGQREQQGKPAQGTLTLRAYHESGSIVVEVEDDGGGLNREVILARARERGMVEGTEELSNEAIDQLILEPGFSTITQVNDISGRGVGMDVVRSNIEVLGGTLRVDSQRLKGCRVTMRLPLTLAILEGQLATVGEVKLVLPLISISESIGVCAQSLRAYGGEQRLYRVRDDYIPIVKLDELFALPTPARDLTERMLVVVESEGRMLGLCVDSLLGQQQVVVKSLEQNYQSVPGLSGATVLGDGTVALILDTAQIVRQFYRRSEHELTHAA